jgi:hypothetical protein
MEEIEQTCPPEDRTPQRRVFPGAGRQTVGSAMRTSCKNAGPASYSHTTSATATSASRSRRAFP